MDSSLTGSACGCLYFPCHENTETVFEMMSGPFIRPSCGCRLYCCMDPARNQDMSAAAQAAGQTTSIPTGDYAFQEQLFGGAAPDLNNLPTTVLPEPTADTPNDGVPAQALAAENETSNRLGNALNLDNPLFHQSPSDLNRPPSRGALPGLDRQANLADSSPHPVVSRNENGVLPQDTVPAMYDPLDGPRPFSTSPPLTNNMILDSDNVDFIYSGNNAPIFPIADPPRTCPECGYHMERYDVCTNHRVPHYRELALCQGTECTYITDPARRLVRIPDHYPFYMDLSGFDSGQPDTGPRETHASRAVTPAGHQGQGEHLNEVHPPPNADAEDDVHVEEEDVPATASGPSIVRSRRPSFSAALEQSRGPLMNSDPSIPRSPIQQSQLGPGGGQRLGAMTNIGEDIEGSDTTIGQSRTDNQAGNTGPPRNAWPEGRPNGRPQLRAQDELLHHASQPTSKVGQSISSRSYGYRNSSYSSTSTDCSTWLSLDSSTPSPPASDIILRSGRSCSSHCINTERKPFPRDYNMQNLGRRSTRSDFSSAEISVATSTTGSTDPISSSTDLQWERPAYRHRQRYYVPLHQRVGTQFRGSRGPSHRRLGYPSTVPGPRRCQRVHARGSTLSESSQTRAHRHPPVLSIPHHQLVPILGAMICGLLAITMASSERGVVMVSCALGLYICLIWGLGVCGRF